MYTFISVLLLFSGYLISNSGSTIHCEKRLRFVQERNIFREAIDTRVGKITGEHFLEQYLNQSRFVGQDTANCVDACTR